MEDEQPGPPFVQKITSSLSGSLRLSKKLRARKEGLAVGHLGFVDEKAWHGLAAYLLEEEMLGLDIDVSGVRATLRGYPRQHDHSTNRTAFDKVDQLT